MEVIAKNSKTRSTLHGVIFPVRDRIVFTFHVVFDSGSRYQGRLSFSGKDSLIDYLMEVCGFEKLTFKKS